MSDDKVMKCGHFESDYIDHGCYIRCSLCGSIEFR